jgi:hypothetical protein
VIVAKQEAFWPVEVASRYSGGLIPDWRSSFCLKMGLGLEPGTKIATVSGSVAAFSKQRGWP